MVHNKLMMHCKRKQVWHGFFLMKRLLTVKDGLEQLVADPEWTAWADQPKYATAAAAAKTVVHDHRFWKAAQELHRAL